MKSFDIPMLIRGKLIWDHLTEHEGRRGELTFRTPDVMQYLDRLPLADPTRMADMYELRIDEVVAYLDELSKRLSPAVNPYMQEAYELSCVTSGLTPEILYAKYREVAPAMLSADTVREVAETRYFDPDLRDEITAIRDSPFYKVVGGEGNLGAVVVSHIPEPVDFADSLACRVANFVPCDQIDEALGRVTIHTQTIGVYPESLKAAYRERLAFLGGQRIVSLGHHLSLSWSLPHDGMEPIRRLCRWINDEDCSVGTYQNAAGTLLADT